MRGARDLVVILAGGPSMNVEVAESVRRLGAYVIVTNDTYLLYPDADMLFAADAEWWQAHPEATAFGGEKVVCQDQRVQGATYYRPPFTGGGGNSALHAARLAAARGARTILLFGVDLVDGVYTHWHGEHGHGLHNPNPATFKRARKAWAEFAEEPKDALILNCNPHSGLTCFPRVTLEEAACQT